MFDTKIYSPPSFVTFIMPKAAPKQQPTPVRQDLQIHFTDSAGIDRYAARCKAGD